MLATYAASRHRQIVPCCMISSVSHDNVSRLVTDRSMCFATALDKAFENIDCMSAILRYQAKNRFYESTQRLIQPRRVLWAGTTRLPYKVGKRKGTVKDKTLHDLVFGLFSYAAGADGALSLDKNRNFNKEGSALAEALNKLRPYLPKGVIPDKLPLGTLQR